MIAGVDWRQKLETQRGAVLATELKNNANKLAKWTAAALVGGADMIKLGYVSRAHPKDNFNHVILGTQVGATRATCGIKLRHAEIALCWLMQGSEQFMVGFRNLACLSLIWVVSL